MTNFEARWYFSWINQIYLVLKLNSFLITKFECRDAIRNVLLLSIIISFSEWFDLTGSDKWSTWYKTKSAYQFWHLKIRGFGLLLNRRTGRYGYTNLARHSESMGISFDGSASSLSGPYQLRTEINISLQAHHHRVINCQLNYSNAMFKY